MNESLFVGLTSAFGIYMVTSAIPRFRTMRALALAFVLTIAFFMCFYAFAAQHFPLADRLFRGFMNGTLVAAAGVAIAYFKNEGKT